MRVHGALQHLDSEPLNSEPLNSEPLNSEPLALMLQDLCTEPLWQKFQAFNNLDFAPGVEHEGQQQRFRANYFMNDSAVGACFRVIPNEIPELNWANFPEPLAKQLASFRNGLVLLSGVTGSGKTTTLAMIINQLVQAGGYRIITVEDPIEYQFNSMTNSIVTARQVGRDVETFADGLKYGLRQDPDVILVGEIRDKETAQMALSAAETGHLVFSTLHTRDAKGVISRITDFFPQNSQVEIRAQLAMSLRAVVSQHLIPSIIPGEKRELAIEVLFNNHTISAAIRQNKLMTIDDNILAGKQMGMIRFEDSIKRLLADARISQDEANVYL